MPIGTAAALTAGASVLGGLLGGKKQSATQQNIPYLPDNYQQGFTDLLKRGTDLSNQPFQPKASKRAKTQNLSVFDSQGLADLQNYMDAKAAQPQAAAAPPAAAPDSSVPLDLQKQALVAQFIANNGQGFLQNPMQQLSPNNMRAMGAYDPSQSAALYKLLADNKGKYPFL